MLNGKNKKESHPHKPEPSTNEKLQMLHMDLYGPMWVGSINGKRYILFIVGDYSRLTWVKFLRTKDKAPEIIIKFLKQAQVSLKATVRYIRIDNGTKFINQTLQNYMKDVGISHTTSIVRTPQQNGIVERRNHTILQNQAASTSAKPPIKNDWDLLFQLIFDEYFKPPSVVSTTISTATLHPPNRVRASSSTTIDQGAPSPSTSLNNKSTSPLINSTNVEEPKHEKEAEFDSDRFTNPFAPLVTSSAESSSRIMDTSNMHSFQKP
uniref:Integrase, catalytic region, zinc finger, CCHC-type, peptidase aspartic, catalytic n=1 Tax=Tanacetum cinerariifolium TaxID=118510 RepID=A0A6L2KAR5_TANCI|nr:integrase, catalytic region, zinc finger, CCHC-type, peptidase aspartic, catalytic [Tanacetum cinerariifolium]